MHDWHVCTSCRYVEKIVYLRMSNRLFSDCWPKLSFSAKLLRIAYNTDRIFFLFNLNSIDQRVSRRECEPYFRLEGVTRLRRLPQSFCTNFSPDKTTSLYNSSIWRWIVLCFSNMDSTSTVGGSVESTPQRTDFDNRSVKSDETLGANRNRMAGTFRSENKAVRGFVSKKV